MVFFMKVSSEFPESLWWNRKKKKKYFTKFKAHVFKDEGNALEFLKFVLEDFVNQTFNI